MTVLKILLFGLFTSLSLKAENFSFMLSNAEQQALGPSDGRLEHSISKSSPNNDKNEPQKVIFLSAILYFSPDKWTLWLNDQAIHHAGKFEDVFIKAVTPNHVILTTTGDNGEEFLLKPNQSFLIMANKIVEGDKRTVYEVVSLDKPAEAPKHKDHEPISGQGFKNE